VKVCAITCPSLFTLIDISIEIQGQRKGGEGGRYNLFIFAQGYWDTLYRKSLLSTRLPQNETNRSLVVSVFVSHNSPSSSSRPCFWSYDYIPPYLPPPSLCLHPWLLYNMLLRHCLLPFSTLPSRCTHTSRHVPFNSDVLGCPPALESCLPQHRLFPFLILPSKCTPTSRPHSLWLGCPQAPHCINIALASTWLPCGLWGLLKKVLYCYHLF